MGDVDPQVAKFFELQYSGWKNALSRWHKRCGGKIDDDKERKKRSFPVADRRSSLSGFKDGATLSDATPYGYPSKSVEDQKTDDQVAKQARGCKDTIAYIQKVMGLLNNARTTGRFPSMANVKLSVRKQPRFISAIDRDHSVSRGEVVEVTELKGDFLHIKTADVDGWIHKSELMPNMPIEADFSNAPERTTQRTDDGWIEIGVSDKAGAF
jgi:hypothetical protein